MEISIRKNASTSWMVELADQHCNGKNCSFSCERTYDSTTDLEFMLKKNVVKKNNEKNRQ
jgi:hypothetical protein